MRALIVGDTHGRYGWIKVLAREALAQSCSVILSVGDFGFWEHSGDGRVFLDETSKLLAKHDLELWWVDGNHENHELLRVKYGAGRDHTELWPIRDRLFYIPRGHRWEWDGVKFLGLGGAYSIDQDARVQGVSWWPEETITTAEAYLAIRGGRVDVMITHDCPTGVDPLPPNPLGIWPEAYANRKVLTSVVDEVQPTYLFHGHYHHRHTAMLRGDTYTTRIEGLANDGTGADSWMVFDTASVHADLAS